jgi:hypothetical protein
MGKFRDSQSGTVLMLMEKVLIVPKQNRFEEFPMIPLDILKK